MEHEADCVARALVAAVPRCPLLGTLVSETAKLNTEEAVAAVLQSVDWLDADCTHPEQ